MSLRYDKVSRQNLTNSHDKIVWNQSLNKDHIKISTQGDYIPTEIESFCDENRHTTWSRLEKALYFKILLIFFYRIRKITAITAISSKKEEY